MRHGNDDDLVIQGLEYYCVAKSRQTSPSIAMIAGQCFNFTEAEWS